MSDGALRALADRAGIRSDWMDYRGNARIVKPDTLHALLDAMELPSATPAQIRDSDAQLNERERQRELPPMLTAPQGCSRSLRAACGAAPSATPTLETEDGRALPIVPPNHKL